MERYEWDHATAWAVCMAESGGNPNALNLKDNHNGCVGSAGLMQIACIHTGGAHEFDPERNMATAWAVYNNRLKWDVDGWNAWGAYTDGRYLGYLK